MKRLNIQLSEPWEVDWQEVKRRLRREKDSEALKKLIEHALETLPELRLSATPDEMRRRG